MINETYKQVHNFPHYEVSNFGNVRRKWKNNYKNLAPYMQEGYYTVKLCNETERKALSVHRLVLIHHGPEQPENAPNALHRDDDKTHNCLQNLVWGDAKTNGQMAVLNGKLVDFHLKTFLTKEEGQAAKAAVLAGESMKQVAKRFGCSRWTVSNIVHDKIQKFL